MKVIKKLDKNLGLFLFDFICLLNIAVSYKNKHKKPCRQTATK